MQNEKKYFLSNDSMLDADSADFVVPQNSWVNMENFRTATTDAGVVGTVESVGSNLLIPAPADIPHVVIGNQKWSLYNLDVTEYRNGDPIPEETNPSNWASLTSGAWCWYNNDSSTGIKLYNWYAVIDPRGIAPFGWSVPSDTDYDDLATYLGGASVAGGHMKSLDIWNFPNTGADNSSGFTGLPHGRRNALGTFVEYGDYAYLWTTVGDPTLDQAYCKILSYDTADLSFDALSKKASGFSVRLVAPANEYLTIGVAEDIENKRMAYFNCDTLGGEDKILCVYTDTNTIYQVLTSSQVEGGLNFSKDSIIHSARISNNILSWVDGTNNEPRKINMESGIVANDPTFITTAQPYQFPLNFSEITMIKPPPSYAANFVKDTDTAFKDNFIFNQSFQFAFQYQYYDYETSVIGAYSASSRLNNVNDTYNRIIVSMDSSEIIPNTVKYVNLIARFSDTNNGFIVKTWDKDNPDDLTAINNQNNGVAVLSFNFYNSITGEYIPSDDILRPFDNVPVYSQSHEIAKNRYFLANNTEGYNTPLSTSMSLNYGDIINPIISTQNTNVLKFRYGHYRTSYPSYYDYGYAAWYLYLSWVSLPGYYLVNGSESISFLTFPTNPATPAPITVDYVTGLTWKGATLAEVINNTKPSGVVIDEQYLTDNGTLCSVTNSTQTIYNAMPQLSMYKSGIVFYDYAMRKCGVVTNNDCIITTTERSYTYSSALSNFKWELNSANQLDEIPEWAYYYAPVITKNQTKRFFVSSFTNEMKYATKDTNGNWQYSSTIVSGNTQALAINTAALIQNNLGYIYNEGDVCILTKDLGILYATYNLPVIGQDNNYILLKFQDIGSLSSIKFVYEIYSPYKTTEQEPFYEVGDIYKVDSPGTLSRAYTILFGYFNPDSYILSRSYNGNSYLSDAMSPNDLYYKIWATDAGKTNFITKLGQSVRTQSVSWSDVYIPESRINGTSTFRLLNEKTVPQDCGSIQKIQLTSKIQGEGNVMLSICTAETNSMYLGETQIIDSTGATQFFGASSQVISTVNTLKGSLGTINPESVVEFRGRVYWGDANRGVWAQYSENGLFPISQNKMTRFWKAFFKQYISMTKAEIEALGSRPFIFSTVDASHLELLISIPKLLEEPPKGYLPDYPSEIYPFDIWDGQTKTIVYNIENGVTQPHWQGAYMFCAESFGCVTNNLYSMKEGQLYLHNQTDSYNEFYGETSPSRIMVVSNQFPSRPKVYNNVTVESNMIPVFTYFYNDFPYLQTSDLEDIDYRDWEGVYYASLYRNKIVPTNTGFTTDGLLTFEKMRNVAMKIMLEFDVTTVPCELKYLNIGFQASRGHTT